MTGDEERAERARLLATALADFEIFCRALIQISPKGKPVSKLRWNPIQRRYCERRTRRDIILKSRRVGMTTLELARDVWKFLQPNQKVVFLCQTDKDQTYLKTFSRDVQRMFDGLVAAGIDLEFGATSAHLWTLPGRDSSFQIVEAGASEAAAEKKGRGGTITRLHSSETAFYEYPDTTFNAILEAVPPDGEIVFESTPKGAGTFFHNRWLAAVSRKSEYRDHFFAWFDDPDCVTALDLGEVIEPRTDREKELVDVHGVSPEQLKFYRAKVVDKGQSLTDQEYPSDPVRAFLASGRTYFDIDRVEALGVLHSGPPIEVDGHLRVWKRPELLRKYVLSVDPAEGLGEESDDSYAGVFDRETGEHVASHCSKLQPNPLADDLVPIAKRFNDALVIVERNKGMALISAFQRIGNEDPTKRVRIYQDKDEKPGFATTAVNKPVILENLAEAIRDESFITHDELLVGQMKAFVINPRDGKPHAPSKGRKHGTSDDGIIMSALALHALGVRDIVPTVRTGGSRGFGRPSKYGF